MPAIMIHKNCVNKSCYDGIALALVNVMWEQYNAITVYTQHVDHIETNC